MTNQKGTQAKKLQDQFGKTDWTLNAKKDRSAHHVKVIHDDEIAATTVLWYEAVKSIRLIFQMKSKDLVVQ